MSTTIFIIAADLDTFVTSDEKTRLTAGAAGSLARYAQAIDDANSEVACYVGAKTLASIPGALKRHACAIARYSLWKDNASPKIKEEYEHAMAFLKLVANGTISLPLVPDPEVPESSGLGVYWTAKPSRFDGTAY